MRLVAQIAVALMAILPFAFLWRPWATIALYVVLYLPAIAAVLWYVIFTLPHELVDRHAAQLANPGTLRQVESRASGGLGDYHIHRA